MLHLLLGPSGSGKSRRMRMDLRARAERGEDSLLIVPEQFTSSTEGLLYRTLGDTLSARVESHSFTSLAEALLRRYGGAAVHTLDEAGRVLLVRRAQALIEANPNVDFEDLCAQLRMYQASLRTCFTLENFDNLIKNGRMRPLVGTLLHSLGIHVIADATPQGTIHVADKARGEQKTYRAIAALMSSSKDCAGAEVVISHCENLAGALALKEQILASLPVKSVDILSCRGLTSFYAMEKGLIVGY